ncbi:type II secretion system F family protein [Candidatus Pacearchaeota archaeon]|nr:type II secretion system F family protein [Candidatus Pacearchaeota archaeon]
MIEYLKKNLNVELMMAHELGQIYSKYESLNPEEIKIYDKMINSLVNRIKILNGSIPEIINNITPAKKLEPEPKKTPYIEKISIKKEVEVFVPKMNKTEFMKELNIDGELLKKVKKQQKVVVKDVYKFQTSNPYGRMSNRLFLNISQRLVDGGAFKSLRLDIRKSNLNILSTTFLSMIFFSTLVSFFLGVLIMGFFLFFNVNFLELSIKLYSGNYLLRFLKVFWIPFAMPILTFILFYSYPGAEKKSIAQRIDREMPFVVIHMASISGSGIEPIEIFKIIALSKEYEFAGREFRKILNQTNLYGYDLSTALRNVSASTPSLRFSELLNGMGVTINSGGDIRTFFEKRAESLLLEHRLEREKAIKSAETFMDLYISIVIATPMIMMMLLVIISVSKINTGFNTTQMTTAIMGIVAIVNILFLTFLHMKQPTY